MKISTWIRLAVDFLLGLLRIKFIIKALLAVGACFFLNAEIVFLKQKMKTSHCLMNLALL